MAVRTFPSSVGSIRAKAASETYARNAGGDEHWLIGVHEVFTYYSYGKFDLDWSGVKKIIRAELVLTAKDIDSHAGLIPVAHSGVLVSLLTGAFNDGDQTDNEGQFVTGTFNVPKKSGTYIAKGGVSHLEGVVTRIDVSALVARWAPNTVISADNKPGGHVANHGIVVEKRKTSTQQKPEAVLAGPLHTDAPSRPYIELTYEGIPTPGLTFLTGPESPVTSIVGQSFTGSYTPSRTTDRIARLNIELYRLGGSTPIWKHDQPATASATETGLFSVPLPALMRSGVEYEWRARVKNSSGEFTAWTPKTPLRLLTEAPTLTGPVPSGTMSTLSGVLFGADYQDVNGNALVTYQIQARLATSPTDPSWDSALLWDTGPRLVTASDRDSGRFAPLPSGGTTIRSLWGGPALAASFYSYRVRATDDKGATSNWVYGSFTLTAGYEPEPGETSFLTGYGRRQAKARVVIREMGADRAPGAQVAVIEDASNIGASEFYNSPGEFFFSLPSIHPQVGAIEPWQVHYALELHRGQGWQAISEGLIVDYDADGDEVIFYGLDYLGILALIVDERFNSDANPDAAAVLYPGVGGGSKYVDEEIGDVVADQIQRAINSDNSLLGFFEMGSVATMEERVTIFSTFKERLPFIAGLLDSHRAGTGKRTRIKVRRTILNTYQLVVLDNPGISRDNIRLEHGGLIQNFRVVPFGEFGTRLHAIGRAFNSTKVEHHIERTPVPSGEGVDFFEERYGRITKVQMWQDISDANDLKRRAKQAAVKLGKVGKQLGLALRVSGLEVKDGWDICDSFVVDIERGVVSTSAMGSGYWTVWGWALRIFPDGHTDLQLSFLPREDDVAPDPDLIPSSPIITTPVIYVVLASRVTYGGEYVTYEGAYVIYGAPDLPDPSSFPPDSIIFVPGTGFYTNPGGGAWELRA